MKIFLIPRKCPYPDIIVLNQGKFPYKEDKTRFVNKIDCLIMKEILFIFSWFENILLK